MGVFYQQHDINYAEMILKLFSNPSSLMELNDINSCREFQSGSCEYKGSHSLQHTCLKHTCPHATCLQNCVQVMLASHWLINTEL